MLLKTVEFNEKSRCWENNKDYNFMFLRSTERYINELIKRRGYIYLNQIYEYLGVDWNPDDENVCIRNDGVNQMCHVEFEFFNKPNNSFLIKINCRI